MNKKKSAKTRILCAIISLLLISGCGLGNNGESTRPSEAEPSAAENSDDKAPRPNADEKVYRIPLFDTWTSDHWEIDKDGNEVVSSGEAEAGYTEYDLTDLATGEVRYRYRMREDYVRDEQDNPQARWMCALYDLDGNQLIDWEDKSYRNAFGDYIIRRQSTFGMVSVEDVPDSFQTALYHVPTGAESYPGVFDALKLNDSHFLLLDSRNTTLAIIDSESKALTEFPMPNPYYSVYDWNGNLTACSAHPYERTKDDHTEFLLEFQGGELREAFSAEWLSNLYGSLRGNYIAYHNGSNSALRFKGADWGIYQPGKGVVFETDGASIEYFDGELAIVQTGLFRGNEPINASLVTAEHEELATGFSWLIPAQSFLYYDSKEPAEKFIGLSGDEAVLLDRTGNVLASSPVLSRVVSVETLCDGLYTYYVEDDPMYGTGLLGPNLEVLVSADVYSWINIGTGYYDDDSGWDGSAEKLLLEASKEIGDPAQPGRTIYRTDILNHTGKVVADNVTLVYDIGPDRIALKRGFDIGLMDWDGNWVVKRRIFTGLGDD